jgi:FKBP-type peptidyl-prolyl cis-trans isomerase
MNEQNEPTTLKRKQHKNISKDSTSHSPKKIKTQNNDVAAKVMATSGPTSESPKNNEHKHPKSKKELRLEKKALKKAAASSEKTSEKPTELSKEEKKLLSKENRKIIKKEQRLLEIKEQRKEKNLRKQKRLRREMNAPGGANAAQSKKLKRKNKDQSNTDSKDNQAKKDKDSAMNIYNNLFNGTHDDTTGTTTLRMGVKYIDVVEGKGDRVAEERMLVTVSYKLKGGKFGAVIDSSKNFAFRLGTREVIVGWDIGVVGMREGGRRHLIVPAKAGYGSEDIGAGPGATLFFDITLLSIR